MKYPILILLIFASVALTLAASAGDTTSFARLKCHGDLIVQSDAGRVCRSEESKVEDAKLAFDLRPSIITEQALERALETRESCEANFERSCIAAFAN